MRVQITFLGVRRAGTTFNNDRLQDLGGMSHGGSNQQIANASTTNTQAGQDIRWIWYSVPF